MYDKTNLEETNNYHNYNSTFIKPRRRLKPLTIREYEADFREHASDQQLVERVFHGGIGDNQLRAALWPLILGLVNGRGRFVRRTPSLNIRTATSTNGHSNGRSNGFGRNGLINGQSNNQHNHNHRNHPIQYASHNNNQHNSNNSSNNSNNNNNNNRHYRHHGRLSTGLLSPGSDGRGLQRYQVAANGRRGLTLSSSSPAFTSSASDASRRVAAAAAVTVAAAAAAAAAAATNKPGSYLGEYDFIDHEDNLRRWRELERQFRSYESQWRSIQPEQELRFSAFRDRKALIERDVIRSDRSHPFYADNSENLQGLTTILMTYMMYDFDIGYLQGMSDIAAPILYVYQGDLVKAFWVFVEVMKLFRRNFETSQKTIHFQLNCLYRLVKLTDAKLARHLRENECSNCFFVFRCIVCQFKRELMKQAPSSQDCSKVTSSTETNHSIGENSGGLSDGLASSAASSSSVSSCSDSSESSSSSSSLSTSNDENDLAEQVECNYNRVLNLWDTIWCVQKRHELKSKCVHTYTIANGRTSTRTPLADIQRQQQQQHQHQHQHQQIPQHQQQRKSSSNSQPIKQKQIVYTKETFYSSFDPNQADVPRFELTETEKFVLSLCLSLIRRERNEILKNNMDASEIHQHFINPSLAEDFDTFVEQAYELYEYLNTDCDLKLLVKGADELAGEAQTLDSSPSICADEHLPSTADTYELLKDYLIISPTAYNTSMTSLNNLNNRGSGNSNSSNQLYRHNNHHNNQYQNGASLSLGNGTPPIRRNRASRYSVSQKSWDHFLNSDTLQ